MRSASWSVYRERFGGLAPILSSGAFSGFSIGWLARGNPIVPHPAKSARPALSDWLDDAVDLTDTSPGRNGRHALGGALRQSVFGTPRRLRLDEGKRPGSSAVRQANPWLSLPGAAAAGEPCCHGAQRWSKTRHRPRQSGDVGSKCLMVAKTRERGMSDERNQCCSATQSIRPPLH
jgi:hypothetical protein